MATYRTRSSGTIEACIRSKQLPGPVYLTFGDIDAARQYCAEAESLIRSGSIPPELLKIAQPGRREKTDSMQRTVGELIHEYLVGYHVTEGDKQWLAVLREEVGKTDAGQVTVKWALDLVRGYKLTKRLAPATIRHRVGTLRRCLNWHVTMGNLPINPLMLIPERYATYNDTERAAVDDAPSADNARDRRLEVGEEDRIRKVLSCDADYIKSLGVERGIKPEQADEMRLLFDLAIETAMRLREMFTLTADQVDIERRTIFLDKTKNGDKRQVPMSSVAAELLAQWVPTGGDGRLFSHWNGDGSKDALRRVTSKLSGRWRTVARLAKCVDLHFHDLRHEATSRLFERTTLTDLQIAKITGHRDLKMLRRYSNLRGSDLAARLW